MKNFLLAVILLFAKEAWSTPVIYGLDQHYGSENGGLELKIVGSEFSSGTFNIGDAEEANLGNSVTLYSDVHKYVCDVMEVASDETTILCTTRAMQEGLYHVMVEVNGEVLPESSYCNGNPNAYACSITIVWWRTPTLQSLSPVTSHPGAVMTFYGRLFTSKTQSADLSSVGADAPSIVRVWAGGRKCELYESPDVLYGVELGYDETQDKYSNWGSLKCKYTGNYVASQNASFVVDNDYGNSKPDTSVVKVSSDYKLYSFQTYAGIDNVSPSTGSSHGGTLINVTGDYFDDSSINVLVGGSSCEVIDRQDTSFTCLTRPLEVSMYTDAFPGSRGILVEIFPGLGDTAGIDDMTVDGYPGATSYWHDKTEITFSATVAPTVVRIRGFFIPAKTGTYTFSSNKPDSTTIYISSSRAMEDKTEATSARNLDANYEYYYEVIHTETSNTVSFALSAYLAETDYVYNQTATAKAENQAIVITSPSENEIQTIKLNNWIENQSPINETFQLCVNCDTSFDEYTISVHGRSVTLSCSHASTVLKFWLEQLLSPKGETVTVEDMGGTECTAAFTITFESASGPIPLTASSVNEATTTVSLVAVTPPSASLAYFTLAIDGVPSPHVAYVSTNSLENAVKDLFGVSCPAALDGNIGFPTHFSNFESLESSAHGGEITTEDSYCGFGSLKNPEKFEIALETPYSLDSYSNLCFAHRGVVGFTLTIDYAVMDNSHELDTGSYYRTYQEDKDEWKHTCVVVWPLLQTTDPGLEHWITAFSIKPDLSDSDFFLDNIFVGSVWTHESILEQLRELRQVPDNLIRLQDVTVTKVDDEFRVEMTPRDCATGLPLLQVAYGTFDGGDTYTSGSWGSASITIKRAQSSAPAAGGTFSITLPEEGDAYGGSVENIEWNVEADELEENIESIIRGVNDVTVTREGTCRSYTWSILFENPGGAHKNFVATENFLNEGTIEAKVLQKGGLYLNPIYGDWLRVAHKTPQVEVIINNVPSRCLGSCTFAPDVSATPVISTTSISSTTVSIVGTGFHATSTGNTVKVGGVECAVGVASETNIECALGESPTGVQPVIVTVNGKGDSNAESVNVPVAITAINPQTGSANGGTVVTLTGTGFSENVDVQVGGPCAVTAATYTTITCTTAVHSAGDGPVLIGATEAEAGVVYTFTEPTAVGSVSTTTLTVLGGSLTITGTGFGSDQDEVTVFVGEEVAGITSFSDTEIIALAPSMAPATYSVRVLIAGFGDANLSDQDQVQYDLLVTGVTPSATSMMGGVEVEISGSGFVEGLKVEIGGNACEVKDSSVTANSVTCTMASCGKTHRVENTGTSANGHGYAWNPSILSVNVGDEVVWSWSQTTGVSGAAYQVFTTASATTKEHDNNGFDSGTPTSAGSFSYQFNVPGRYFYVGVANEAQNILMRGIVDVSAENADRTADVSVSVGGHEALHSNGETKTVSCQEELTPTITGISDAAGTSETEITITGARFSEDADMTSVFVGDAECSVQQVAANSVTCKVETKEELTVGLNKEVAVKVAGKGTSRTDIRNRAGRYFVLLPHVASVTPSTGSLAGGTKVTIQGGGLAGAEEVLGIACDIVQQTKSYTAIECITAASAAAIQDVEVQVEENSAVMTAECSGTCTFEYTGDDTPTVTNVQPSEMHGPTTVTITGTGLQGNGAGTLVSVGSVDCTNVETSDTTVTCQLDSIPFGDHVVTVTVDGKGFADTNGDTFSITSVFSVTDQDGTGSIHGGHEIEISGNGFVDGGTIVRIGSTECLVTAVTPSRIACTTGASEAGLKEVVVTSTASNDVTEEARNMNYEYTDSNTPIVTSVSPALGQPGQTIQISVTGLVEGQNPSVKFGGVPCDVTDHSASGEAIACTLGSRYGGAADIVVNVPSKGYAGLASGVTFHYQFDVTSIEPASGSLGGGQSVTITGYGFNSGTTVSICNNVCAIAAGSTSTTSITCTTPESSTAVACEVVVTNSESDYILKTDGYTYDDALTPQVTGVQPPSGGTGGGTLLTISGDLLSGVSSVIIDGSVCDIVDGSKTMTSFQCTTNSHVGTKSAKVEVYVGSQGMAKTTSADFYYVDRWSSVFTWGGSSLPQEDQFVIIDKGQTILLDTKTARLKMLLIQGGELIFEDTSESEIHLQADNILIVNNGLLQIGTEENPYEANAQITMHGHLLSPELPIYGAKTLGVREGRLEMHGRRIDNTWTQLDKTAAAGDKELTLQIPVTWNVGDKIVIASTGYRHSQEQNEEHEIAAIEDGADGKSVITLKDALEHQHLGITETYTLDDGTIKTYDYRAEVGLLTRNIVFRGSDDDTWHDTIEGCDEEFNTGQFAAQTCFQGRAGEEEGSDEYGASIMIHSKTPTEDPSSGLAIAHIEYVELTYVGQAFRLGRYPIHWHLMGDMTGNYVRGCALHQTFNRAVTIHGTHNLLVEHNVIYNVMGGAFFLEDGIETGNTVQYNLAVFVRQSTSLLNDDITPAAFWVTNPDNIIQHNHAAGGTHFGFWYRMHEHPDGPSFDASVCQQHVELGVFRNNSAHTQGWFGLWIFQTYKPMEGGGCNSDTPMAAKFNTLTAWHCEKGAEWVEGGAIQFHGFELSSNEDSGIDIKLVLGTDWDKGDRGALIKDTTIIGHAQFHEDSGESYESKTGIVLPFAPGLWMEGITFINIAQTGHSAFLVTHISGTCVTLCGGFHYRVEKMAYLNTPVQIEWRWEHEGVIEDIDGSFTGTAGAKVVPYSQIYDDGSDCRESEDVKYGYGVGFKPMVCQPSVRFHRLAFNNIAPTSLEYKDAIFVNQYGNTSVPWLFKRLTHKSGWMVQLRSQETYAWTFQDGNQFSNISYSSKFYGFQEDDYVIMKHQLFTKPDRISLSGEELVEVSDTTVWTETSAQLAWQYDIDLKELSFKVGRGASRKKRANLGIISDTLWNYVVTPNIFRCSYTDCKSPMNLGSLDDVRNLPEPNTRVTDFENPSDCFQITGSSDDDRVVTVPADCWIVWAIPDGVVLKLHVIGNVYFDPSVDSITLTATYIIVDGRFIAGWDRSSPHVGNLHIKLRGEHSTERLAASSGVVVGSKVLACHGTCHLHGKDKLPTWTRLQQTVAAGARQLILQESVNWNVGDEIVIAPSGFNAMHTEKNVITHISSDGRTLTLGEDMQYEHKGEIQDFGNGWEVDMSAEVGVLTKNIKIEGESYDNMQAESYGARVLVTTTESHTAKGQFSNVEFYHSGQEGFYDPYDPRNSLAFVSSGLGSEVIYCSFHDGFSPAIGTYSTNAVNITGNVVHHTINEGIVIRGSSNSLVDNFVVLNFFRGSYQNRYETANFDYTGAINVESSFYTRMTGNVVAGAERVAYKIDGQPCDDEQIVPWAGNVAHAVLIGTYQLTSGVGGCSLVNGFTIYKAWDYGIYQQTKDSARVENCSIIDATVGYLPLVIGPVALTHEAEHKYSRVVNSLFVGRSDQDDCTVDMDENTDHNLILRRIAGVNKKAPSTPSGGRTGIMLGTFESNFNGAPFKALNMNLNYPAIYGATEITDVTVRNFGTVCTDLNDRVFYTNPRNEDAFHPLYITGLYKSNVEKQNYVFLSWPDPSKINPSDCVDMPCDAKVKVLIKDMDGSLLGYQGSIISKSEYAWGDQALGVGDFRIPKPMLAADDGTQIKANDIVPDKGIARNDACTYTSNWQSYECSGADALDYYMLVIESLDSDTETRRLSPVAVKWGTYVDLINGPQDHGWCAGYTCQKRISTFYSIVPGNQHIDLYFTSTPPLDLRLHLLNRGSADKITVGIWIPNPQKLDVTDGNENYVAPTNAYYGDDNKMRLRKPSASNPDEFKPSVDTANSGDNFIDFTSRFLYVCVGGENAVVTIRTQPTVTVTFGFTTVSIDDFFEDKLVDYLAALLGIDTANIRRVQIERETSRRRRSTVSTISLEIAASTPEAANVGADKVMRLFQEGTLAVDGAKVDSLSTTAAMTTELIAAMDEELAATGRIASVQEIKTPAKISLVTQPAGNEQSTLSTSPQVHILDENDELVTTTASTFTVTVSLDKTHADADASASLSGTQTLQFTGGIASFNDLTISHSGTYKLVFDPTGNDDLTSVTSDEFALSERPVGIRVVRLQESGLATEGDELKFELQLTDGTSNDLQDVTFKGYTYKIDVSFDDASMYGDAALGGTTTFDFDSSGKLSMAGLTLTGTANYNVYNLKFRLYTDPASNYDSIAGYEAIQIYPKNAADYTHEDASHQKGIALLFSDNYDTVVGAKDKTTVETDFYNNLKSLYPDVYIAPFTATKTADGKFQFDTIVTAKEESYVSDFVDNLKEAGSLRSGSTTLSMENSCGIAVNSVCYGDASMTTVALTETSTAIPVGNNDNNTTIIIFAALGSCVFVSLCIVVATYFVKRHQGAKVAALRCMDASPMSQRPLNGSLHSFRPDPWDRSSPDHLEPGRMTPVAGL